VCITSLSRRAFERPQSRFGPIGWVPAHYAPPEWQNVLSWDAGPGLPTGCDDARTYESTNRTGSRSSSGPAAQASLRSAGTAPAADRHGRRKCRNCRSKFRPSAITGVVFVSRGITASSRHSLTVRRGHVHDASRERKSSREREVSCAGPRLAVSSGSSIPERGNRPARWAGKQSDGDRCPDVAVRLIVEQLEVLERVIENRRRLSLDDELR